MCAIYNSVVFSLCGRCSIISTCPDQRFKGGVVAPCLQATRQRRSTQSPSLMRKDSLHTLGMSCRFFFVRDDTDIQFSASQRGDLTRAADSGSCCSVLSTCVNPCMPDRRQITIRRLHLVSDHPSSNIWEAIAELISICPAQTFLSSTLARYRHPRTQWRKSYCKHASIGVRHHARQIKLACGS